MGGGGGAGGVEIEQKERGGGIRERELEREREKENRERDELIKSKIAIIFFVLTPSQCPHYFIKYKTRKNKFVPNPTLSRTPLRTYGLTKRFLFIERRTD